MQHIIKTSTTAKVNNWFLHRKTFYALKDLLSEVRQAAKFADEKQPLCRIQLFWQLLNTSDDILEIPSLKHDKMNTSY